MKKDKFPAKHPYSIAKFYCPCCHSLTDTHRSVEKFQRLLVFISNHTKKFYTITYGFRCLTRNKKVGGAEKSDHLAMLAIDVAYETIIDLYQFVKYLTAYDNHLSFRYIRIYKDHIHISLNSTVMNAFEKREPKLSIAFMEQL